MIKKLAAIVAASAITMILTTIFRPLELLQSTAIAQPRYIQSTDTSPCQSFSQTGFAVCGKFLTYWHKHGGVPQFGYPISTPVREKSSLDGKEYIIQYFERAVFELHPENRPPYDVLLSHLGAYIYKQKYPNNVGMSTVPSEAITDPQPDLGVSKSLRPGISIQLIRQEQASITGLAEHNCGLEMTWVLQVQNNGSSPFVAELDRTSITMHDSTGKTYAPTDQCGGRATLPYSGSFSQPQVLKPGDILRGTISFQVGDIPRSASYFELGVGFSSSPAKFRYQLP
jgi:hypothetical protein